MLPTRKKKSSANAGSGGSALSTADQAKKTEEDEIEQLKKELEFEQKVIMTLSSICRGLITYFRREMKRLKYNSLSMVLLNSL